MDKIELNGISINKIESPISAFNNILVDISKKIEKIYFPNNNNNNIDKSLGKGLSMGFMNDLIFENEKITIFNKIKIIKNGGDIKFRFCGEYDKGQLKFVEQTINNTEELKKIFHQYIYVISLMENKNIDDTITEKFLNSIQKELVNLNIDEVCTYLLPYKNKIKYLYDKDDELMEKLYNRYTYLIKFTRKSNKSLNWSLIRVLSSELDETKSIENLRYTDVEILLKDILNFDYLSKFLYELYYYGEILKK